jgi:tetratricopeptide (TPR) repeat protein
MDSESLEALFVGRHAVMSDVVDKIVASVHKRKERHYVLLVGPRGSGKTHFVALAYHRIRSRIEAAGLTKKLEVAYLNEEEWGVASYLDFLVRILRALASESNNLETAISSVFEKFATSSADAEGLAESLIASHVREKTLLLICENLTDLFEGLGDEGQKRWRAFIQQTSFWSILATTPALFAALRFQEFPFYGFFTIRTLKKIDFDTARELLDKKALHDGKQDLARFLNTPIGRARVHAIHHLAAGNHRAYVVLYDFLDKESLDELVGPFMHMVDDLTPYYQDKMRQLAPAQRKIVEYLCQKTAPITVKEVAKQCLMSQQTAAKQIGELAAIGFVSRMPLGRQTFCELAEPLMRICIEVKDNRTEHFRLFVEFLRHWFSSSEIENRISLLDRDGHGRALDRAHLSEALRCFRLDANEPFVTALKSEAWRCYEKRNYSGLAEISAKIRREGGRSAGLHSYVYELEKAGKLTEAARVSKEALVALPDDDDLHFLSAEICWNQQSYEDALAWSSQAISLNPKRMMYRCFRISVLMKLERYEEAIQEARSSLPLDPHHWHSYAQILEALVELGRVEDARQEAEALLTRAPDEPEALSAAARYFYSQDDYERTVALLNKAIAIDGKEVNARYGRGLAYFDLKQYQAAREDLEFVVSARPKFVGAQCRLSDTLMHLGDYQATIGVAERMLKVDPEHTHGYVVLGRALMRLGQVKAGLNALNELLVRNDVSALLGAASVAVDANALEPARQFIARAVKLAPELTEVSEGQALFEAAAGNFDAAWLAAKRSGSDSCLAFVLRTQASRGSLLDALDNFIDAFGRGRMQVERREIVRAITRAISASVKSSASMNLPEALERIKRLAGELEMEGLVGEVLSSLLPTVVGSLEGRFEEWERALKEIRTSLGELKECRIPLAILSSAVGYRFTGEKRYMLQLPLEQRQLLESVLSKTQHEPTPE